ncbi:MAG: methylenetetrahydrofolate--tRNA-(uracil(54)-C(5))-methyltransferase (FADH(2)-oxidizing) TrmFO [Anaerosomatales bacterium]
MSESVTVVGGGLAGTEAAWQLAQRGVRVQLIEMRPATTSPAHSTDGLAELVCSNSFKGTDPSSATGTLKRELERLGSVVLGVARRTAVPAGAALAVDRTAFSAALTGMLESHPLIEVLREEAAHLPEGRSILATGPLTSPAMEAALSDLVGSDRLAFYDAAAPIVDAATIDRSVVFAASRYGKGGGADYLNCPLDREQYEAFIAELRGARRVQGHEFEKADLFQACQPIEEIARSGLDAARFGALKPVGLTDPNTGERPWAVVQLRPENAAGTAYNLVGFQTNLAFGEQRRVFGMIPGLATAEFLRYGVMHRNTFIDAPSLLDSTLALRDAPHVRIAGQLTGTEGYLEAAGSGLLAALNTVADLVGAPPVVLPPTTALGALIAYATDPGTTGYQPMHVNWGLVPPLYPPVRGKRNRYSAYAGRAADDISAWASGHPLGGGLEGSVDR